MTTAAGWWDNPEQGGGDSPVVRHAPDPNNYHIPDHDMLSKMRGSQVGRFAVIPAANRDGTSKGFDATVAGPVHVDPDAPDGGVIFDPSQVHKGQINQAIAQAHFPHQAFYKLGTPAPLLGYNRGRYYRGQPEQEPARVNPVMPGSYVTPRAAQDGSQIETPNYVGNGQGQMPQGGYDPMYQAQEEQRVHPAPPLSSLPPMVGGPAPVNNYPQAQPMQPHAITQPIQAPPGQQPGYPPQAYPQPMYQPPPPAADPQMMAMMQQLMMNVNHLAGQVAAVRQQPQPLPVTGMSPVPLPNGPPPGLATVPRNYQQRQPGQPAYPGQEDYSDESARPIRKQVKRSKKTQDIIDDEEDEGDDMPVRRSNSLVQRQQAKQQTVRQYREAQDEDPEGIIVGFETLNLPFVTGPVANRTHKQVFLEIPNAGKHGARYHDVIESEACVVLVYDTRYEDGSQYLPPNLGEQEILLHVPSMKKTFKVASMGFHYSFGVFDHVVLIKTTKAADALDADG